MSEQVDRRKPEKETLLTLDDSKDVEYARTEVLHLREEEFCKVFFDLEKMLADCLSQERLD